MIKQACFGIITLVVFYTNTVQAQFNLGDLLNGVQKDIKELTNTLSGNQTQHENNLQQADKCHNGNDFQGSMATGGILGAISGAIFGKNNKDIAIGTGIGILGGIAIGSIVTEERKKYCSEAEFLDTQIKEAQYTISEKEQKIQKAEQQLQTTRTEIRRLEAQKSWNRSIHQDAERQLASLEQSVKDNEAELTQYQNELNYLEQVLQTAKAANPQDKAEVEALEARRKQLTAKHQQLATSHTHLLNVNTDLKSEKDRILTLMRNRGVRPS